MSYRCSACGHKMPKAAAHGGCAACGSTAVRRVNNKAPRPSKSKERNGIEIAIMILLWSLLIYGVYDKFIA